MTKSAFFENTVYEAHRDCEFTVSTGILTSHNPCSYSHFHKRVELLYTVHGALTVQTEYTDAHVVRDGELLIVEENVLHRVKACDKGEYLLLILPDTCTAAFTTARAGKKLAEAVVPDGDERLIEALMRQIIALNVKADAVPCIAKLCDALFTLAVYRIGTVEKSESRLSDIKQIIVYIVDHIAEPFTIKSLAARFGYTPRTLSAIFEKYVKRDLKSYITAYRVSCAKRLLAAGNDIPDAAEACGFGCVRSMSRAFEELEGTTPAKWKSKKVNSAERNAV